MNTWEIAIAGDSFTELGYLPEDQLFTTIVGRELGCRVLNLGVAQTAGLAQLSYLQDYGRCSALRQTVIVFFEGNDIPDLAREYSALLTFEATGERPYRVFEKQTSLLAAFGDWLAQPSNPKGNWPDPMLWLSRRGPQLVTVTTGAPRPEFLGPRILSALERFYRGYREFGDANCVETWLAYMPSKARVLHGQLRPAESGPGTRRIENPSRMPDWIAEGCRKYGIRFIDLTPALALESERSGELVYNPLYDIHLNARGSAVVGRILARALRDGAEFSGKSDPS
jgi:hypothetical protein